jgi:hypothetical protein
MDAELARVQSQREILIAAERQRRYVMARAGGSAGFAAAPRTRRPFAPAPGSALRPFASDGELRALIQRRAVLDGADRWSPALRSDLIRQRTVEVGRFRITDVGRRALEG